MSTQHTQYMLLFLVLVVNSNQFQILPSYTLLYSSRPFLCALDMCTLHVYVWWMLIPIFPVPPPQEMGWCVRCGGETTNWLCSSTTNESTTWASTRWAHCLGLWAASCGYCSVLTDSNINSRTEGMLTCIQNQLVTKYGTPKIEYCWEHKQCFFQWLLSWLLHKWREGYLLPTWVRKNGDWRQD